MGQTTTNLGLNTFAETDIFDVSLINENFWTLDNASVCTESGTMSSNYTGAATGTATWRYKRYTDKTIELNTAISLNSVFPNNGSSPFYYSRDVNLSLPLALAQTYDIHIDIASSTNRWGIIISSDDITSGMVFRILSNTQTSVAGYQKVYIQVKGVEI